MRENSLHWLQGAEMAIGINPDLGLCTPASLVGAVLEVAHLGLSLSPKLGQASLVPFKDEGKMICTLIIGYRGMVQLVHRSDRVKTFQAFVVHQADYFDWELGTNQRLVHRPGTEAQGFQQCSTCGRQLGDVVAAYSIMRLMNDGVQFIVLDRPQLNAIRARSRAKHGPWQTDTEAMMQKTPARTLFKWAPVTEEVSRAVAIDEAADADLPQDLEAPFVQPETPVAPEDKLTSAARALKGSASAEPGPKPERQAPVVARPTEAQARPSRVRDAIQQIAALETQTDLSAWGAGFKARATAERWTTEEVMEVAKPFSDRMEALARAKETAPTGPADTESTVSGQEAMIVRILELAETCGWDEKKLNDYLMRKAQKSSLEACTPAQLEAIAKELRQMCGERE